MPLSPRAATGAGSRQAPWIDFSWLSHALTASSADWPLMAAANMLPIRYFDNTSAALAFDSPGISGCQACLSDQRERRHHRIRRPDLVFFPPGCGRRVEALAGLEPLLVVGLGLHEPQQVLGRLLVLRIGRDDVRLDEVETEHAFRACRQECVLDVVLEWLAVSRLVLVGLARGLDVDRRTVQRRADGAGQEGAVVGRVVPSETALVHRILPEAPSCT